MRNYRLLEVSTQYDKYLSDFYRRHSEWKEISYDELYALLINDGFADCFIHEHIKKLGNESKVIFWNNRNLQNKSKFRKVGMTLYEILLQQIADYKPDVLLMSDMVSFSEKQIQEIKNCISQNGIMVGYHFTILDHDFWKNVPFFDQIYTGNNSFVEEINDGGGKAFLLRHAFESSILERIGKIRAVNKPCFLGSIFLQNYGHGNRIEMLKKIYDAGLDIDFLGDLVGESEIEEVLNIHKKRDGVFDIDVEEFKKSVEQVKKIMMKPVFGMDYYRTISEHTVGLNIHGYTEAGGAGNIRMYEVTGLGSCLVTDYKEDIGEYFVEDEEIVVYRNFDEMTNKIEWLLNNPNACRKIAENGQRRTLKDYTFDNKARQLDEYIQMAFSKK